MQAVFRRGLIPAQLERSKPIRTVAVTRLNELAREYEARHYPPTRRLDLQAEGPDTARERALRWIQTFAHEQPGAELLLVVERGRKPRKSAVRIAVEQLLDELKGGLLEWWQPFAEGSLAVRVAREPTRWARPEEAPPGPGDEGRSAETAGAAFLAPESDIPPELLETARRAAEHRRMREGLPAGAAQVVLRGVWNQVQAAAMERRITFADALAEVEAEERRRLYEDE